MGGWAIDAYKAQQDANSQATNAIANAAATISADRARWREGLLKQLQMEIDVGGEDGAKRRQALLKQLDDGYGIAGDIKSIFTSAKPSEVSVNGYNPSGGGNLASQQHNSGQVNSNIQGQLNAVKDNAPVSSGVNEMQGGILNELKNTNPDMYKKMLQQEADRENIGDLPSASDWQKEQTADKFKQQIADYKSYQKDQKVLDAETAKENKKIAAMEQAASKKQQQIDAANEKNMYANNKPQWYANKLEEAGLNDTHFTGDFGAMHDKNDKRSQHLIDLAVQKGDYAQAEKFNREWKANRTAIDKYWNHQRGKDDTYDLFKMPKGGGGDKFEDWQIIDDNGQVVQAVEVKKGGLQTAKDRASILAKNNFPAHYKIVPAGKNQDLTPRDQAEIAKKEDEISASKAKNLDDMKNEYWFGAEGKVKADLAKMGKTIGVDKYGRKIVVDAKNTNNIASGNTTVNTTGGSNEDKVEYRRMSDGKVIKFINGKPVK